MLQFPLSVGFANLELVLRAAVTLGLWGVVPWLARGAFALRYALRAAAGGISMSPRFHDVDCDVHF